MSRGTRTCRAVTLWPEADNLSVASGGLGGLSVGDEEAGQEGPIWTAEKPLTPRFIRLSYLLLRFPGAAAAREFLLEVQSEIFLLAAQSIAACIFTF